MFIELIILRHNQIYCNFSSKNEKDKVRVVMEAIHIFIS